jgi:hypothetical protein
LGARVETRCVRSCPCPRSPQRSSAERERVREAAAGACLSVGGALCPIDVGLSLFLSLSLSFSLSRTAKLRRADERLRPSPPKKKCTAQSRARPINSHFATDRKVARILHRPFFRATDNFECEAKRLSLSTQQSENMKPYVHATLHNAKAIPRPRPNSIPFQLCKHHQCSTLQSIVMVL